MLWRVARERVAPEASASPASIRKPVGRRAPSRFCLVRGSCCHWRSRQACLGWCRGCAHGARRGIVFPHYHQHGDDDDNGS
jgi:hypothetical protein